MNKPLITLIVVFLAAIPFCYASGSMSFLLHYDKGDVSLGDINILERSPPDFITQPEVGFAAGITSFNGSILFARRFEFPLKDYDSIYTLDKVDYALMVPYFNTGQYFYIFDKDAKQIIKTDLSEYAVCNQNGVCNPDYGETLATCEEDCRAGMPVEEQAKKDVVEQLPEEAAQEQKPVAFNTDYMIISALALVLVIIIIIALASRKKQAPQ